MKYSDCWVEPFSNDLKFNLRVKYRVEVLDSNAAVSTVRASIARELKNSDYQALSLQQTVDRALTRILPIAKERLGSISTERTKVMIIYETYANSKA